MTDRRTGGLGANADIRVDPQRRSGAVGANADIRVDPQRQAGALGVTVDLRVESGQRSIPIDAVFSALATRTRSIPLTASLSALVTAERSVPLTAALRRTLERSIPLSAALVLRLQRSVPLAAALLLRAQRSIPLSARLLRRASRSIPLSAEFTTGGAVTRERSVPISVVLSTERAIPLSAVFFATSSRAIPLLASTHNAAAVAGSTLLPFAGVFVEGVPPPDPEPVPPAATVHATRQVPLGAILGQGLTVPLTMPIALSPVGPTDYEYVWSQLISGPDCVSASISVPGDPSDDSFVETGAPEEAIYVQADISGSAPEGASFLAIAQLHSTAHGWHIAGGFTGYNSWNPLTAQRISNWQDLAAYGMHDLAAAQVQHPGFPPARGGYSATVCFTWRGRQEPEPDPPPCVLVMLTTEWYRTGVVQHTSPRVPYQTGVPVPWQARRFRVWYLPFVGDTTSSPTVAVRNSTSGWLPYAKDVARYYSPLPTGTTGEPHYVSDWLDPVVTSGGPRMAGLHMLIETDDQNADSIPFHQGQQMRASVVIEWDCENSIGIPIDAVFESRKRRGPFVQIVG